jgi:alanine dehydrogenase
MISLGVIREGKVPFDRRVLFSPAQCAQIIKKFAVSITVQSSKVRCFTDEEYTQAGITVQEDLSNCEILVGIKEVNVSDLIPNKTYFFFSHTIKKQSYNRKLLLELLEKKIRMIDYEVLTDEHRNRLIAFGYYAGVVGAHNGLWAYGQRTKTFDLPRMRDCYDYAAVKAYYKNLQLPPIKIVLTGGGRVATGAYDVLNDLGIKQVSPMDFVQKTFNKAVFTQLQAKDYVQRKDGKPFRKQHFYKNGAMYESKFAPFIPQTDIFINGIYYDSKAPAFFTPEQMTSPPFRIQTIADISCDIVPNSSLPVTLRASTIADPLYGYDPKSKSEVPPFTPLMPDVMSIDNLPSELPRDASVFFGEQFINNILPELVSNALSSQILARGTIAQNGELMPNFQYLEDWVKG